jgi:hypothetical protein
LETFGPQQSIRDLTSAGCWGAEFSLPLSNSFVGAKTAKRLSKVIAGPRTHRETSLVFAPLAGRGVFGGALEETGVIPERLGVAVGFNAPPSSIRRS